MPATVADARDLLIASVLCPDPVLYIDDRWLYDHTADVGPVTELDLSQEGPKLVAAGDDLTLVASGFAMNLALQARDQLAEHGVGCAVVDLRVLNPLDPGPILESVRKTSRLLAVDGGWRTCGMAAEVLALVTEHLPPSTLRSSPARITLPDAPAPTSKVLEDLYYPTRRAVVEAAMRIMTGPA